MIVYRDGKVLLIKRGKEPYREHWSLPGGSQETGETLEECAIRELREETGIEAQELEFAAVRDRMQFDDNNEIRFHFVLATYIATRFTGEAVADDDAKDCGWFSIDEMKRLKTTPETPGFVEEILSARNS